MAGFDPTADEADPTMQTIYQMEGWAPGKPVGKAGDAGRGQVIPSTARMVLANNPDLFQKYPDIYQYANPSMRTADPSQDPLSHYLNDPAHDRANRDIAERYVGLLRKSYPGAAEDPALLFQHYNGSPEYGRKAAALYAKRVGQTSLDSNLAVPEPGDLEFRPMTTTESGQPVISTAATPQGAPPGPQYGAAVPPGTVPVREASAEEPQQPQPLQPSANDPWAAWQEAFEAEQQATTKQAMHQMEAMNQKADLLDQVGKQLDQLGGPPHQQPIDPKQYYANIGHALGAQSPGAARLVGGIATGIFAGLGTLGAAIAHSHNDALDIIREGIQNNIAAQNQNAQISRQQWADQYGYILKQVQAKTDALAAHAGAQDVIDGAARTNAGAQLDLAGQMAKMTLLPPEAAAKTGRLQSAQSAVMQYEQARRDAFNRPRNVNAALRARSLAIDELAKAMTMSPKGPSPEDYKTAEALLSTTLTPNDWANDNIGRVYNWLREQGEITTQSSRGLNTFRPMPPGATPNNPTKPTDEEDEE